jgi:protein-S-isoprenylcysteine O-methyltransferase Ste14
LVILLPLQASNARKERQLLRERFGERYEAYRRTTLF